jgi:outer membrane protein
MTIPESYKKQSCKPILSLKRFAGSAATKLLLCISIAFLSNSFLKAQVKVWSVDDCIKYALDQNLQILIAKVGTSISQENLLQSRAALFPSLSGSVRENFNWNNQTNTTTGSTVFKGSDGTNISVSSNVTLFNSSKLRNNIMKSETDYEAVKYNVEVIKENISLSVLNAYLQVLFAEEQVKNTNNQVNSTTEQLKLAEERMKLGVISNSDYLLVKSQLATESTSLASAQSQLAINRVTLMQLMELPVTNDFRIEAPNLDSMINLKRYPSSVDVYKTALEFKPEVKNAELGKKSAQISVDLAKADFFPSISMNAGLSTLYSGNNTGSSFGSQLNNNISPAIGLSVSVPIYLNRQVKTRVEIARLNTTNAELNESNTKNILRKAIEQACLDVTSSQIEFEANSQQYQAAKESFDVASEKYFQGIMNSVDFLIQRTNFISAESAFLQSKFRLIFSYKILDFYLGVPLTL